jgi:hypothetical protein
VLPCRSECFAVQATGVDFEQHAAEPLCGLDLDPPGAAGPAGRLDRPHIPGQRLGPRQPGQVSDALGVGVLAQGCQQRPGRELGAGVGAQQGLAALLPGRRILTPEHGPHLLGCRHP